LVLFISVLLIGCATAPPVYREPGAAAAWLGGTPRVVVRLNAAAVQAWGEVTRTKEALKTVGERTKTVWMGFELDHLDDLPHAADTVRIVLEGDFPKTAASLMLDWNGAWKKGAEKGLWTNAKMELSVTLPEDGLVAVRRHDPSLAQPASGVLRDLDPSTVEKADLWLSFWSPGQALFGAPGAKLLPVERLDVMLFARDGVLEGPVILRFPDDRAAKAATVLLKLFAPQIQSRFGQELQWSVQGSRVVGETLSIQQKDLRALAERLVADTAPQEATP